VIIPPSNASVLRLLRKGLQLPCYIPLHLRDVLKFLPLQGYLQPGKEEEITRGRIWRVRQMGRHWDAVLGQEFTDNLCCVTWRNFWCTDRCRKIILGPFRKNCILRELQKNCLGSVVRVTAWRGKKILDLSNSSDQRRRSIFSWFLTGLAFLSSTKVTMLLSTQVSRIDTLIFFQILKLIIFRFTEFPSELHSNILLRQRTQFTVRLRKNLVCILLQITSVTPEMIFDKYSPWLLLL